MSLAVHLHTQVVGDPRTESLYEARYISTAACNVHHYNSVPCVIIIYTACVHVIIGGANNTPQLIDALYQKVADKWKII